MKTIQRSILISIVPLVATAFAETGKTTPGTTPGTTPAAGAAIGGTLGSPSSQTKASTMSSRASQVIGLNLKNATGEAIGEVKDLVFDMKSGEILAVIVSSGTYLGTADTLSALPVTTLRLDAGAKQITTRLTKEQLGKAPQFKNDAWPDYNQPAQVEALRSFRASVGSGVTVGGPATTYGTGRDAATRGTTGTTGATGTTSPTGTTGTARDTAGTDRDTTGTPGTARDTTRKTPTTPARDTKGTDSTAADNSAQNKKEMDEDAVNPTDQGNSAKDVQITKDIRAGIMDADLSFNAKNIKIITRNEYVTLKGVVQSHDEHQAILKIARNHAKTANITDDLKVKSK